MLTSRWYGVRRYVSPQSYVGWHHRYTDGSYNNCLIGHDVVCRCVYTRYRVYYRHHMRLFCAHYAVTKHHTPNSYVWWCWDTSVFRQQCCSPSRRRCLTQVCACVGRYFVQVHWSGTSPVVFAAPAITVDTAYISTYLTYQAPQEFGVTEIANVNYVFDMLPSVTPHTITFSTFCDLPATPPASVLLLAIQMA